MKILVTGGAGMIGSKLAKRLAADGTVAGGNIDEITLFDVVPATEITSSKVAVVSETGDLRSMETVQRLIAAKPEVIFHLAAIVSGEAEQDFDKGYGINLDGTRNLLEAIRHAGTHPRFVFASSIAVFGAPFPDAIPDNFFCTPLTSYGTQKAICELLVSDYSRRGILDGLSLRLPTICVRPGKPNAAASGFFSNIIREPLAGQEAVLPVSEDVLHWHASPRAAVNFMLHAASLDLEHVGSRRAITLPGLAVTVGEQIEALRDMAGDRVVDRIRHEPDDFIQNMVAGWPRRFDARRSLELGFKADVSFAEIIRIHIEDELAGEIA
jgi:nucleoside-diphosphate-sugar epimerase